MKPLTIMNVLAAIVLAASVGVANAQTTLPTPLLWYNFDGNLDNAGSLTDSKYSGIGNLFQDGSAGLTEFEDGIYGYSADNCITLSNGNFGTDGDRLVIPFELSSLTSGSMSFWLKANDSYDYNSIFSSEANSNDWEMFLYGDQSRSDAVKARIKFQTETVSTNPGTCMQGFGTNWWNHYTFAWDYDGSTVDMKLYLNGKLDQWYEMEATSTSWTTSGSEFYLGGGPSGVDGVNGGNDYGSWSMDDFRIYDTALDADEAFSVYQERNTAIYENTFASSGSAVVTYDFKDDASDIDLTTQPNMVMNTGSYTPEFHAEIYNGAGDGNIVFVNDPVRKNVLKIEQVADSLNQEYSYHLQSDYTLGGTLEAPVNEGTISFWLKVTEFNELGTIFDSADGRHWEAFVFDDGHIRFAVGGDSYTTVQLGDYGDGQDDWHHVAFRWVRGGEGEEWRVALWCFIDGEEADYDEGSWQYGNGEMSIGGLSPYNPGGNFLMDDFSIFEAALDDDAIKAIYLAQYEESKIPGDANNDGKVDGSDVTILAGNWQKGVSDGQTASWEEGDFNGDGKVDGSDVTILAGNWQYGVTAAANAVPEPSMIVLLSVLASLGLFLRRR